MAQICRHNNAEKLTAAKLRTLFLTEDCNPASRFSKYYSDKLPDVFVSYPWDLCLISELPIFLEDFEQWIRPLSLGDKILVSKDRQATVRYIGPTTFGPGEWVGAELDQPSGLHNGGVYGQVKKLDAF